MRPGTLHIEVLRPVSTRNWTRESLDKNLQDLHQHYLKALDNVD